MYIGFLSKVKTHLTGLKNPKTHGVLHAVSIGPISNPLTNSSPNALNAEWLD